MGLIANGINNVRAWDVPLYCGANGKASAAGALVLVEWKSIWEDKFYQVYVDGRLAGIGTSTNDRQMVVQLGKGLQARRIEVFAVEASEADKNFGDKWGDTKGKIALRLLRKMDWPVDGRIEIFCDHKSGIIDYSTELNREPIPCWDTALQKPGFGMGSFANCDFGYDGIGVIGFGGGEFGEDEFGFDCGQVKWLSEEMPAGRYMIGVRIMDGKGNSSVSEQEYVVGYGIELESGELMVRQETVGGAITLELV